MENDVRAEIQWVLEVGAHESVIHHHECLYFFCHLRDRLDVRDLEHRVGRRLEPDECGLLFVDEFLESLQVRRVGVGEVVDLVENF